METPEGSMNSSERPAQHAEAPARTHHIEVQPGNEAVKKSMETVDEPSLNDRLRQIQNSTLNFLANASNETLGACAVGLCASTYLVLGRVGLVLIGAVGGIVLHATWEGNTQSRENGPEGKAESLRKRRELGLEVAKRVLEWRETKHVDDDENAAKLDKIEASMLKDAVNFSAFQPSTAQALTDFSNAVIRDYVKWWYGPILPRDDIFPSACQQILVSFIVSFSNHLARKRTADPFLDFIANATSIVIVFLNELSTALRASPNQPVEVAINTYLEHSPDSSLANVLSVDQQEKKLNLVAEDILQTFLDSKTYNCAPARLFLRETLAKLILQATVDSCAKPEWINGWIVYLLQDGEPELMNAIDASVEGVSAGIQAAERVEPTNTEARSHKRRISRAEEAMQEAMREAQRINQMIAEEDARRKRGDLVPETEDALSVTTTDAGINTPNSSDSGRNRLNSVQFENDMVFDSEGNAIPSGTCSPVKAQSPVAEKQLQFTSFDQIAPQNVPTALQQQAPTAVPPPLAEAMIAVPLTLHNASITIMDMGTGSDRVVLKQAPNDEMLVQIEPAASRYSGWMVTRKYPDFEKLHETLRRIAVISGVVEFSQQYELVPSWRSKTRAALIAELETYLRKASQHDRLAESEAMKKFLDKASGISKMPVQNKNVLLQGAAALDNVGKGFVNVLGQGGKGIAGGGKAVLGGVQGVFGAVATGIGGPKKPSTPGRTSTNLSRVSTSMSSSRMSQDQVRSSSPLADSRPSLTSRPSGSSFEHVRSSPVLTGPSEENFHLPPPPSEITDEYEPANNSVISPRESAELKSSHPTTPMQSSRPSVTASPSASHHDLASPTTLNPSNSATVSLQPKPLRQPSRSQARRDAPLTEEETRITVDLMFAIITSTYSLSSAWTFRLSLLSAAKTYILRPNNPQLESIRTLIQESFIGANTSDAGIAGHINKLRENTLPTDEERAKWPKELDEMQKEELRIRARKLLVERGMPQALTSVMGSAASGEAMGRVFDSLQIEGVAKGFIFAVMLQALKAVTQ